MSWKSPVWPAGCFDRVLLGLGWSNTWLQPEAPGQPGALWARRGCHPEGSRGCFRSASHYGQSGSSLDIHQRTTVRACAARDAVNSSKWYLVTCTIIMIYKWLRHRSPRLAALLDLLYGTRFPNSTLSLLGMNIYWLCMFLIMWFQLTISVVVFWTCKHNVTNVTPDWVLDRWCNRHRFNLFTAEKTYPLYRWTPLSFHWTWLSAGSSLWSALAVWCKTGFHRRWVWHTCCPGPSLHDNCKS